MPGTAIRALSDVGDERDIALLIHVIGDRPTTPGRTDDDRLKQLVRWPDLEADALTRLVTRLGQPALRPLLQAMILAPRLPFDDHLNEFIHVQAKGAPREVFEPLLAAPNQAGRFAAALELAPLKKDPRVIPILLEIVRGARPDVAIRVKAAYAQAERGDPSALSIVLAASKRRGTCETILFIRSECNPYLDDARAAIDLMRVKLHPPVRLTADAGAMTGLPQVM